MKLFFACVAALALAVGLAGAAPRDLVAVTGTITHESRGQFIVLRADDGRTYYVDVSRADFSDKTRGQTNRPVSVIGAAGARSDEIRAYIVDIYDNKPRVAQGYTDTPQRGVFQRVHGAVQSISGDTATVRTDEGRTINVNLGQMDRRDAMRVGEHVTLVGRVEGGMYRAFWARARENDTFTAAPTDRKEPGAWRRLHGTIESRQGTQMMFRADRGRLWTIDLGGVPDNQRRILERGQRVTIAGFPDGDRFVPRYIALDDGREPDTATTSQPLRPSSKDDCQDGGWQKFTNPTFKNQGDCVSWTNKN